MSQDTLRPRDFVDDFPLHLWLFLPRQKRDETPTGGKFVTPAIPGQPPPPTGVMGDGGPVREPPGDPNFNPSTSSPLQPSLVGSDEERPMISFIAHVSSPIQAELERLQFLFLLRLKDSFNELKTSAMKFLSLVKPVEEQEPSLVTSPATPRHRSLGNRHDTLTDEDDFVVGGATDSDKPVQNLFEEEVNREKNSSASIAGCIVVRHLQADILLPSIFTEKTPPPRAAGSCRATPTNTPQHSSMSPEPPPAPSPLATPIRLASPQPPLPPSSLTLPPPHPPHSHSGSPSSLLSQTSSTSQTSFGQHYHENHLAVSQQQMPARTMSETRLTSLQTRHTLAGSHTSLPVLYESGGQGSSGHHGDRDLDGYRGDQTGRHGEEVVEGEFVMVHTVTVERREQSVDTRSEFKVRILLINICV